MNTAYSERARPSAPGLDPVILLLTSTSSADVRKLTLHTEKLRHAMYRVATMATALDLKLVISPLIDGQALMNPDELLDDPQNSNVVVRRTPDVFQSPALFESIDHGPRRVLVLAGVATEVEVQLTALTARRRGFEVHVIVDAVGGIESRTEITAFQTLASHGVHLSSTWTLMAQLLCDVTTPEAKVLIAVINSGLEAAMPLTQSLQALRSRS